MLVANRASAANIIELVFLMTVKPAGAGLALSMLVALVVLATFGKGILCFGNQTERLLGPTAARLAFGLNGV